LQYSKEYKNLKLSFPIFLDTILFGTLTMNELKDHWLKVSFLGEKKVYIKKKWNVFI
jgi:hypothetical protein